MKTVVLKGKQVDLIDVPIPSAFDNYAVVRIFSAPMCTEYRKFGKDEQCMNIGHEAAGEIFQPSAGSRFKPGDRVIVMPQYPCGKCELCLKGDYIHCQNLTDPLQASGNNFGTGTYAEYLLKPEWLLIPIPDDITFDEASMACCGLGPALGAGKAMHINNADTILITGGGPVALGAVIYCTDRGANVILASRNEYRRSLAASLGAHTFDPLASHPTEILLHLSNEKGIDKVIECTGDQFYQQMALSEVKRKGQIAFIGESSSFTFDLSAYLLRKGLTFHGIWHWNINYSDDMIDLIRRSKDKIGKLITHVFPMEKAAEAFQIQLSGNCGKVILRP